MEKEEGKAEDGSWDLRMGTERQRCTSPTREEMISREGDEAGHSHEFRLQPGR